MVKLAPYIFSENAREQGEFYVKALRGEIVSVQTFGDAPKAPEEMKEKVMHLVLQVGGLQIFLADSTSIVSGNQLDLTLEYGTEEEARAVFAGLAEGGNVIMAFERMFWGTMFGRIQDPYGVRWQIVTAK